MKHATEHCIYHFCPVMLCMVEEMRSSTEMSFKFTATCHA